MFCVCDLRTEFLDMYYLKFVLQILRVHIEF
jgi:hypothetical protein